MGTSIQTMITFVVHPTQFGKALGNMTLFQNVARAFGPFAFAPLYEHVSHSLPWYVNSLCKLLAMILCLSVPFSESSTAEDASEPREEHITEGFTNKSAASARSPGAVLALMRSISIPKSHLGVARASSMPARVVIKPELSTPLDEPANMRRSLTQPV